MTASFCALSYLLFIIIFAFNSAVEKESVNDGESITHVHSMNI
jgi:hypothetical protein